jgi:hypothetical protein
VAVTDLVVVVDLVVQVVPMVVADQVEVVVVADQVVKLVQVE